MKRQRTELVPTEGPAFIRTRAKRPIDKLLVVVNKTDVVAAQQETDIITATFPCTAVGLRWDLSWFQTGGTGEATTFWAVVIVRDGNAASTMSTSDAGVLYAPEQDVLTFGTVGFDNHTNSLHISGDTKTMRKLMGGDKLKFITFGTATNFNSVRGVIQVFCKS